MIAQKTMRGIFFLSTVLAFSVPVALASISFNGNLIGLANALRVAPGLDAFAAESRFPVATALGLGLAALLSLITACLFIWADYDRTRILTMAGTLSRSQKVLYGTTAVLVAVLPWLAHPTGGPHQFSYALFQLVANHPTALGIFAAATYAYSTVVLIFVRCLFLNER